MRKLLLLSFLIVAVIAHARQISEGEAASIASEFLNSATIRQASAKVGVRRAKAPNAANAKAAPFYVYNADDNQGFVIISGDDRAKRIVGYSDKGSFNFDNLPPQLNAMLKQYEEQIKNIPANTATHDSWKTPTRASEEGGVLLETANWGQGAPYNSLCPIIDGVQAPTGCVATAMAIVMKYHNWPENGRGYHKYRPNQLSDEFTECDFGNLHFDFTDINPALPTFIKSIGCAVNMNYSKELSSTYVWVAPNAFRRFFRFSPDCQYIEKSHFNYADWLNKIHKQLDKHQPIIYSGFDEKKIGHAFVLDGYKDDLFHINWGWDGAMNGYFDIQNCLDFNDRQGMIVNIVPDRTDKEYSPGWLDYGYLWREQDSDPLLHLNPGTHVHPEEYIKGEPFDFYSKTINMPVDFRGELGLAIVDENENIVELKPAQMVINQGDYNVFCGINYTWNGVDLSTSLAFDSDLPENYKLWVVSKRFDEDKWLLIPGTEEAPSTCRFDDNQGPLSKITYNCDTTTPMLGNPYYDDSDFVFLTNKIDPYNSMVGSRYELTSKSNNGFANIYLNGDWATNTDDVSITSLQFLTLDKPYEIKIHYMPMSDSRSVNIHDNVAGKLGSILTEPLSVTDLAITGEINACDIKFIVENCLNIQRLDISGANITSTNLDGTDYSENQYPADLFRPIKIVNDRYSAFSNIWNIKSLKLPENLTGYSIRELSSFNGHKETALVLGGRNLIALSVPANHATDYYESYIDGSSGPHDYSFQYVFPQIKDIKEPLSLVSFPDYVKTFGTLFVPMGFKDKFRNAEGWRDFKYIVETEKGFNGNIVSDNGAQYIILDDCAALIAPPLKSIASNFSICDAVEYNGISYPVKYIAKQCFYRAPTFIELPQNFERLDLNIFGGSINFTINENLKEIIPLESGIYYQGGVIYLKNTNVLDLSAISSYTLYTQSITPNFINKLYKARVYIPGCTAKEYENTGAEITEMWSYAINKSTGKVNIIPQFPQVVIDRVTINGNEIQGENGFYSYPSNGLAPEVKVDYTVNNQQHMTTVYDADFNAAISDILVESISLSPESWSSVEGESFQITAALMPENATDKTLKWTSNNLEVATVDGNGFVSVLNVGSCTITATAVDGSELSASCEITVKKPEILVSSISLTPVSATGKTGEQIQISAAVLPENATNKTISWSSSDESIATVSDSGLVSLIKKGQAVITASATDESGVSAECAIIVSETSGIGDVLSDKSVYVRIFNMQGIQVYEGPYSEAKLAPDYYIVVCGGKSIKVKVE